MKTKALKLQKTHFSTTYKIYSVAGFDVFKLCDLYSGQIVKRLLVLLTKKSWDYKTKQYYSLNCLDTV